MKNFLRGLFKKKRTNKKGLWLIRSIEFFLSGTKIVSYNVVRGIGTFIDKKKIVRILKLKRTRNFYKPNLTMTTGGYPKLFLC